MVVGEEVGSWRRPLPSPRFWTVPIARESLADLDRPPASRGSDKPRPGTHPPRASRQNLKSPKTRVVPSRLNAFLATHLPSQPLAAWRSAVGNDATRDALPLKRTLSSMRPPHESHVSKTAPWLIGRFFKSSGAAAVLLPRGPLASATCPEIQGIELCTHAKALSRRSSPYQTVVYS